MSRPNPLRSSIDLSNPPPGSVNVRRAEAVEGPGGRWVPCATEVSEGVFYPGVFEVGPGRRQVCANTPSECVEEALLRAIGLAGTAAS